MDNNDIDDELFKNYVEFVKNFTLEKLIHKNAEEFKQMIINMNVTKRDMRLTNEEYLFQIIGESHKLSLKSSIILYQELIYDYHTWLTGNYDVVPKKDF